MATGLSRESARIYAFPRRGRFAMTAAEQDTTPTYLAGTTRIAISESWYHEDAVREEARLSQN